MIGINVDVKYKWMDALLELIQQQGKLSQLRALQLIGLDRLYIQVKI